MEFKEINNKEYFAMKGVNASMIKAIYSDPELYLYKQKNSIHDDTKSLRLGSLVHCLLLEPNKFKEYYFTAGSTANTIAFKEAKKKYPEKTIITLQEEVIAFDIAFHNSDISSFFSSTKNEQVITGILKTDNFTIPVKGKLDAIKYCSIDKTFDIYDLKTTSDQTWFVSDAIKKYYYHISAGWYSTLLAAAKPGYKLKNFYFVVVETKAPFKSRLFKLNEMVVEEGRKICFETIEKYIVNDQIKNYERPSFDSYVEEITL